MVEITALLRRILSFIRYLFLNSIALLTKRILGTKKIFPTKKPGIF